MLYLLNKTLTTNPSPHAFANENVLPSRENKKDCVRVRVHAHYSPRRTVGIFSSCLLLLNNSVELRSGGWSFHPCEDVYVRAHARLRFPCARARREWPISIAVVLEVQLASKCTYWFVSRLTFTQRATRGSEERRSSSAAPRLQEIRTANILVSSSCSGNVP